METTRAKIIASSQSSHAFLFSPFLYLFFQKAHLTFFVINKSNITASPRRNQKLPNQITHNKYKMAQIENLNHLLLIMCLIFKVLLFYRVDDGFKCLWIIHSEICKNFAVKTYIVLCKFANEL